MAVPGSASHRKILTVCVMLATLMVSLDNTIANVALPYMQGSLSASQDQVNWVLTSYIAATAIATPPTSWLAGRVGRTRLFVIAATGFTLASVLCGLARSIDQIVAFRLMQGVFGACLVPLSQSVMFDIYTERERGAAMALWGAGVMVGPILGPTLGGWLTQTYDWRFVFFINVPVGIACVFGLLTFLPELPRSRAKFDWIGFALLSAAVGALQVMLDRGGQLDWFASPEILAEACVAGLGFYCFFVHFLLAPAPFVSPALFRDRNFVIGLLFSCLVGMIMLSTLSLLTPYLQSLMHYPVLTAGIALAPRGAGTMLGMYFTGKFVNRIDVRLLVASGFCVMIYALNRMAHFSPDISQFELVSTGFLQGLSIGLIFVAMTVVTFSTLPGSLRTQATSIYSVVRSIAGSIGIAVTGQLLIRNTSINHASIAALVTPFNHALGGGAPAQYWNPLTRHGAMMLDAEITRQASTIAYADNFQLMMLLCIAFLPFTLLVRASQSLRQSDVAAETVMH